MPIKWNHVVDTQLCYLQEDAGNIGCGMMAGREKRNLNVDVAESRDEGE